RASLLGAFFGFLPRAVWHRSPSRRDFTPADLLKGCCLRSGQVVQPLVAMAAPQPGHPAADNLQAVGRTLASPGALPAAAFEELVRTHLRGHLARLASHLEGQLRRYGEQPGFWADDVRRVLGALHQTLTGGDFAVPENLAGAFGREQGRVLLSRLVRRFG